MDNLYLIYLAVFLITFGVILIVFFLIRRSRGNADSQHYEKTNSSARSILRSKDFCITKTICLNDYYTFDKADINKKQFYIDGKNKKICFVDYKKEALILVNFDEILNYEIYENGSTVTTGGAAAGFWTGVFAAQTSAICRDLKLIIRLKRYDVCQVVYELISDTVMNAGISKSTKLYRDCISTLQEAASFLEVVKHENDTEESE